MRHWKLRVSAAIVGASAFIIWWFGLINVPGWVLWLAPVLPLLWLVVIRRPVTLDELRALRLQLLKLRLARWNRKAPGRMSSRPWDELEGAGQGRGAASIDASRQAAERKGLASVPLVSALLKVGRSMCWDDDDWWDEGDFDKLKELVEGCKLKALREYDDWVTETSNQAFKVLGRQTVLRSRAMCRYFLTVYLCIEDADNFVTAHEWKSDFAKLNYTYQHMGSPFTVKQFEVHRELIEQLWEGPVIIEPGAGIGSVRIRPWATLPPRIALQLDDGAGIVFGTCVMSGEVASIPVRAIPHLLVMGTSGFGKSVFLHQLVAQLVAQPAKEVSHLVLIDLKGGVEFRKYEAAAGGRVTVVWAFDDVVKKVAELVEVMELRLASMVEAGIREWPGEKVFFIVDEFAQIQLYPFEGKEGKEAHQRLLANLNRLSMLGRAAGIVICAAIQKATTDVMDSSFRNNLQGQLCFRVPNKLAAASMFGGTEDLKLDPVTLSTGRFVFYDPTAGTMRYLQAHIAEGAL